LFFGEVALVEARCGDAAGLVEGGVEFEGRAGALFAEARGEGALARTLVAVGAPADPLLARRADARPVGAREEPGGALPDGP
jgi:hypothetical protein